MATVHSTLCMSIRYRVSNGFLSKVARLSSLLATLRLLRHYAQSNKTTWHNAIPISEY